MRKTMLCFLVLLSSYAHAQEKAKSFSVKVAGNATSSFYFTDLEYASDGTVTYYGKLWQMGTLSVTKDGKKTDFGSGNRMVPSAMSVSVKDGNVSTQQDFINIQTVSWMDMKGYDYKAIDPGTKKEFASSADKSADEIMMKYPKVFPAAKEATEDFYNYDLEVTVFKTQIRETVTKYNFDRVRNKLVADKPQVNLITPKMPELDGKYLYEPFYFKDNKRRMLACVAGVAKKGESKFYPMQNRKVVTVSSNGDLVNAFDVQFTFPRSVMFASALGVSVTDSLSTFEEGGIFIFGRVFGGGKSNDPDPTNYDYVIVGPQGELKSKGTFKFGTEKRDLSPLYAYKKENKIYVLAKGVGKDQPGYAILTFDDTGLIGTKELGSAQLKAATFGPYDKGLTTNFGRLLKVTNHINLADGGVLLCGEAFEDETPVGASFSDPKVRNYFSQVFLYIDKDGNLTKNIVVEKLEADSKKGYTRQNLLQEKNGKFFFVSEEKTGTNNFPVLTMVDPVGGTAKKISLKLENVYNIDGDIIYRSFPDRNQVLFLGKTADKDSYTLNCSIYTLE